MTTSDAGIDRGGLRDGEVSIGVPLCADATLVFIGHIETPWHDRRACPRQGDAANGPLCRIHLDLVWQPGLDGVEAHDDLQVLYWMHEARRDLVRLAPRSLTGAPVKPRGPFALRAPTRPNPIASSVVTLVSRDGPSLTVRGLDCLDGTPLLDIKPWRGA